MAWNAEAHGLGSPALFYVGLLNTAYNFTAVNAGPDPKHDTCALIRASAGSDPIILPSGNYSANELPFDGNTFLVSVDTQNNFSLVQFASGFDPLILAAATLSNVAGFFIANENAMASGTKVFAIFPATSVLASVPATNRIRLRNLSMVSQAL